MVTNLKIYTNEYGCKYYWSPYCLLHREDGPAIEYADGTKEWFINGQRHREDGPALEWANGDKTWFINSRRLSYEEWFEWVMTYSSKDNQINVLLNLSKF